MRPVTTRRAAGRRDIIAGIRTFAGARGRPRYAAASRRAGGRLGTVRLSAARVERTWWHRLMDDRDLIGAKLLVLAALLAVTALLERVV
jgi:hypothetical protein